MHIHAAVRCSSHDNTKTKITEENKIDEKQKVVVVAKLTNHGSNGPSPFDVTLGVYKSEKQVIIISLWNNWQLKKMIYGEN